MLIRAVFFGITISVFAWLSSPTVAAGSPLVNTRVVIDDPDGLAEVSHSFDLSDLQTAEFYLLGEDVEDLHITDESGEELSLEYDTRSSWTGGHNSSHKVISADGLHGEEIVIQYKTNDILHSDGENMRTIVANLDGGLGIDWELDVLLHDDLRSINYQPTLKDVARIGDYRRFTFSSQDYQRPIIGLSASTGQKFELSQSVGLPSPILRPREYGVFIPSDTHSQTAYIFDGSIPENVYGFVDRLGNVMLNKRVWRPGSTELEIKSIVRVEHLRYDPSSAGGIDEEIEGKDIYLDSDRYWPTDGEIANRGSSLVEGSETSWEAVRLLHDWVKDNIEFDFESSSRVSADEILEAESGNAQSVADLLVALLRSQDIPARVVKGAVTDGAGVGSDGSHTWVEAYVSGVGWVMLDPLWADIFDSFGYITSDRVAVARIANEDQYREYKRYESKYSMELDNESWPQEDAVLESSVVQYAVVPGVFYERKFIINKSGWVVDDVAWEDEDISGSLAPWMRTSLGSGWSFGFDVSRLNVSVDDEPVAFTHSRSWWPFIIFLTVAITVGMIQFYRYRIRHYLRRRTNGQIFS